MDSVVLEANYAHAVGIKKAFVLQ